MEGEKMKKNINLYKFNELSSTNDYLERNHRNYEEFDVICAKNQTHGRARRQNDWVSMEGMAIFSFFLEERENWEIEDYLKLPLIAGLATIRGLGGIENLEYKFKWTNDVYLENKKLCGILMEKTDNVYIVGIGINVNNILPEKLKNKAISLTQATNKKYKIDEIVKNIVSEFQILCENLGNGSWEEILKEINEINYLKNKKIELKFGNEKVLGIAQDINENGEIEVLVKKDEVGKGEIKKEGKDITIVTYGRMLERVMKAAEIVEGEGISVEVVDPRTLIPLDKEIILDSVKKTGRVILVNDSHKTSGFIGEISAIISESDAFDYLDHPIVRLAGEDVPMPYNHTLETAMVPSVEKIVDAIRKVKNKQ